MRPDRHLLARLAHLALLDLQDLEMALAQGVARLHRDVHRKVLHQGLASHLDRHLRSWVVPLVAMAHKAVGLAAVAARMAESLQAAAEVAARN